MLQKNNQVWNYGFSVLAFVAGALLLFFLGWSFPEIQDYFRQFNAETVLMGATNRYGYSAQVHFYVKVFLFAVTIFSFLAFFLLRRKSPTPFNLNILWQETGGFFFQKLRQQWQVLPAAEKKLVILFFLVLTAVRIWFLVNAYLEPDEVTTYILFVAKGLPGVLLYYPVPNNHVFYSLVCYGFDLIFQNSFLALKLPALFLSTVGTFLFYLMLRSVFSFYVTFLSVFALSFSFYPLLYATAGRGYWLQLVCAAILAVALLKLVEKKEESYWFLFLVASIGGFFSVPTFLYPWATMFFFAAAAFLLTKNKGGFLNLVGMSFFAGLITLLLYLPIMLASKAKQLFANGYVTSNLSDAYWLVITNKIRYLQGGILGQETLGPFVWLGSFLILTFLLAFNKRFGSIRKATGLSSVTVAWVWCGTFLPWLIIMAQRVGPPERTLIFKSFFDFILIALMLHLPVQLFYKQKQALLVWIMVLGLAGYSGYEAVKLQRHHAAYSLFEYGFNETVNGIWESNPTAIYTNNPFSFYGHYLRFKYLSNDQLLPQIDNAAFDTGKNYEFILLEKGFPPPADLKFSDYDLWIGNPNVQILKQRKPL